VEKKEGQKWGLGTQERNDLGGGGGVGELASFQLSLDQQNREGGEKKKE